MEANLIAVSSGACPRFLSTELFELDFTRRGCLVLAVLTLPYYPSRLVGSHSRLINCKFHRLRRIRITRTVDLVADSAFASVFASSTLPYCGAIWNHLHLPVLFVLFILCYLIVSRES